MLPPPVEGVDTMLRQLLAVLRHWAWQRRRVAGQRGQALVIGALALMSLMGVIGFVIDVGAA
jgi:hypothetical protein